VGTDLEITAYVLVPLIVAIVGAYLCKRFAPSTGPFANARSLLVANFKVAQPLSGVTEPPTAPPQKRFQPGRRCHE